MVYMPQFSISLTNYFVMVFTSCRKWLRWNIIRRIASRWSNDNFVHINKIYPLWTSTCSKGLNAQHTPSGTRHEEFRVSFRVSFHFKRSPEIVYCFVFLSTNPPTLGDFVWYHRVVERFIRRIIGFCLLLVRILNKLLSVPKCELCFICVRGRSWGIYCCVSS